jgi:hypothetical protein
MEAARLFRMVDVTSFDASTLQDMHQGFAAVTWCTDVLPDSTADELGVARGMNYARAAQLLRPSRTGPRSRSNPTRGVAHIDREHCPMKRVVRP